MRPNIEEKLRKYSLNPHICENFLYLDENFLLYLLPGYGTGSLGSTFRERLVMQLQLTRSDVSRRDIKVHSNRF